MTRVIWIISKQSSVAHKGKGDWASGKVLWLKEKQGKMIPSPQIYWEQQRLISMGSLPTCEVHEKNGGGGLVTNRRKEYN